MQVTITAHEMFSKSFYHWVSTVTSKAYFSSFSCLTMSTAISTAGIAPLFHSMSQTGLMF